MLFFSSTLMILTFIWLIFLSRTWDKLLCLHPLSSLIIFTRKCLKCSYLTDFHISNEISPQYRRTPGLLESYCLFFQASYISVLWFPHLLLWIWGMDLLHWSAYSFFFLVDIFLIRYFLHLHFQYYPKSPPCTPLPSPTSLLTNFHFLALTFPCTEACKVCKTSGPLFPLMAN